MIPLPPRLWELLSLDSPGNRSLLFDKGMNRYSDTWQLGAEDKELFLKDFSGWFGTTGENHLRLFVARRRAALSALGIQPIQLMTQNRLVLGLGLPSATETGFLFDRLTGCPYLPGSSVKGLLRATAALVRKGELSGDIDYWSQSFDRVFGPSLAEESIPRTGDAIFFDAFPTHWPVLEVDVLTPHYGKSNRERAIPGDWNNPVPVPFLAIAPGTPFEFYIKGDELDRNQLGELLRIGLDRLGIGAKKSSGYGVFGAEAPSGSTNSQNSTTSETRRRPEPKQPQGKTVSPPLPLSWKDVELSIVQGAITARRGKQMATCSRSEVEKELLRALAKHRELRGDVQVLKLSESHYRIVGVAAWRAR